MRAVCGFQGSDASDPLLQGQCPSLECARSLLSLLEDCAEHIAEFARHSGPEAAFYEILERSEMFADCEEIEQAAIQRSAQKDQVIERYRAENRAKDQTIEQQKKTIEKQSNEIALHKRLHRLRQNAVSTHNVSDSARRHQTAVGRRTQALHVVSSDSSVLRSARVGADRSVKARLVPFSVSWVTTSARTVGRAPR